MEVVNIFKEAKLTPSERDVKKITTALNKALANLEQKKRNRKLTQAEYDIKSAQLKSLIEELKTNPSILEQHAREYMNEFRAEIMDYAADLIDKDTKEITAERLNGVAEEFKSKGLSPQDILSILGVKIKTQQSDDTSDGEEDIGPELDASKFNEINKRLEKIGKRTLYEFLGLDENVQHEIFAATIQKKAAYLRNMAQHTPEEDESHHLLQAIMDFCNKPELRKAYDNSLSIQGFEDAKRQIRVYVRTKESFIDPTMYNGLLERCTRKGLTETLSRRLINRELRKNNIKFSDGTSSSKTVVCRFCGSINDKHSGLCHSCGLPLQVQCPNCGQPSKESDKVCTRCGYNFFDMKTADNNIKEAEKFINIKSFDKAEECIKSADMYWPNNPKTEPLKQRIKSLRAEMKTGLDKLQSLCKNKQYYAAKAIISQVERNRETENLIRETENAVEQCEKLIEQAENISGTNQKLDAYYSALMIAKDCTVAQTKMSALYPVPPSAVKFTVLASSIKLEWDKINSQYIKYCVVRKANAHPNNISDGETIGETSNSFIEDTSVQAGVSYYYSVFTKFNTLTSKTSAATANPALIVKELSSKDISYTTGEKHIAFSFALPASATGLEVYRDERLLKTITGNSFTDDNLTAGRSYKYKLCVLYKDCTSKMYKSQGITLDIKPEALPLPVELTVKDGGDSAALSWTKPLRGDVFIFVNDGEFTYNKNDVINMDAFRYNKLNVTGNSCVVNKNFSGIRYYIPVTVSGNMGVAGQQKFIMSLIQPQDVKITYTKGEVRTQWDWSGQSAIRIRVQIDDARTQTIDRKKEDSSTSTPFVLTTVPPDAKSVRVSVCSVVLSNGKELESESIEQTISLQTTKIEFIEVKNVKSLFGLKSSDNYTLTLCAKSLLPCDLNVLISEKYPPSDLVNSRIYLTVSKKDLASCQPVVKNITYKRNNSKNKLFFRIVPSDLALISKMDIMPETRFIN